MDQGLHVDPRRNDVVGIDIPRLHKMLDFGDGNFAGGGHHRIEVARGLAIDEVALGIADPGMDDREIGDEAALHDIVCALELALLLALRYLSPGPRSREECRNTGAARADALGQRALRIKLDLEFTREILLRKRLVLPDIGRDHLLYLPAVEQNAEADTVDAAIVGDDGQVLHARLADRHDELLWNPANSASPGHYHHAVLHQPAKRGARIGIDFLHGLSCFERGPTPRRPIHAGGRRNFLACGFNVCNLAAPP